MEKFPNSILRGLGIYSEKVFGGPRATSVLSALSLFGQCQRYSLECSEPKLAICQIRIFARKKNAILLVGDTLGKRNCHFRGHSCRLFRRHV